MSVSAETRSRAEWIASLPESERQSFLRSVTDAEAAVALYDWTFWARPNQLAPNGTWRTWLLLAGRGFGKTRAGAEWVRSRIDSGDAKRIALVAPTPADARDVMVEGESGLLAISPPWNQPEFQPSKRRVVWPNGALATIYSGFEPDQLRGPQHDTAWCDELASWQYPRETWDNLQFGLRLGDPKTCITTTPRPIKLLKEIRDAATTVKTVGTSYENRSNLPDSYFEQIIAKYEGTTIGQQEIYAALLEESPGALWTRGTLTKCRVEHPPVMRRIVVAIDPAATANTESSETGIVVAGLADNGHAYVLADLSGRVSPDAWARRAVLAYHDHKADRIIGEHNNGGEMVRHTVLTVDPNVSYKHVWAAKGKYTRAEPIAAKYEQGKVHHVGVFPELEDQLCTWVPGEDSPDRLDAMVWALSELLLDAEPVLMAPVSGLTRKSPWLR